MKMHLNKKTIIIGVILLTAGCAYFNTFFNAKKNYKLAREEQKKIKSDQQLPSNVQNYYTKAIEKSWKLINVYSDSNKYADDALLLIGKSHYHLGEYGKAERVLEQFLLKYLKSEYIPEAKLYLARARIALEKDDQALEILKNIFDSKINDAIAAEAFFILGELRFRREEYDASIENLEKCARIASNDELKGEAHFMIGRSFLALQEYENAINHFKKLEKLNVPPLREFEAIVEKVNAMMELERYEEATVELKSMLSQQRFKPQYSLIKTKLGNIYEKQEDTDFAAETYRDVIREYPRSEGAALSSFYMGQIFEFDYGQFDSAKVYYSKVKKQSSKSEVAEDAEKRLNLVSEYLKLRDRLNKDIRDKRRLAQGDSTLFDSVEVEQKAESVEEDAQSEQQTVQNERDETESRFEWQRRRGNAVEGDSLAENEEKEKSETKQQKRKIAVARSPEEVEESLLKNQFALGEFFLLKYQQYDSAAVTYTRFVKQYEDSLLTPKAYYALYYIYNRVKEDSLTADSIKNIIVSRYPQTPYAEKLLKEKNDNRREKKTERGKEVDRYRNMFLNAEKLSEQKEYKRALDLFLQIAEEDSGSIWAKKARYVRAYIYEKHLEQIDKAIQAYEILKKEYPRSEFATIAFNKTKEPAPEPETPADSTVIEPGEKPASISDSLNHRRPDLPSDSLNTKRERRIDF